MKLELSKQEVAILIQLLSSVNVRLDQAQLLINLRGKLQLALEAEAHLEKRKPK